MANRRLYVKKLIKALILPAMLVVCIAQASWAAPPTGGSMSGTVAEYNAAQVHENNGLLTVPSGMVTYTANTAIPAGTFIDVSLPAGMQFTTPTSPSLSTTPRQAPGHDSSTIGEHLTCAPVFYQYLNPDPAPQGN
jgi:hypothetical protein